MQSSMLQIIRMHLSAFPPSLVYRCSEPCLTLFCTAGAGAEGDQVPPPLTLF